MGLGQVVTPLDPRIHFALVCGAKSCPSIKVYTAEALEEGLEAAAAAFCESASPRAALLPESLVCNALTCTMVATIKIFGLHCTEAVMGAGEVEVRESNKELVMSKIFSWCARRALAEGKP